MPPGNYFAEVCVFGTPPFEPRTYTGTLTIDDTPAPHPYLARWQVFPANPPLAPLPGDPWGNPSTDTRELWCWDAGEAADCDKVVGNLASRAPVGPHPSRRTLRRSPPIGNNAVTARPGPIRTCRARRAVPADEPEPRLPRTRGRTTGSSGTATRHPREPSGATWDDSAAVTNLFVAHNRMHDWAYYLGFTERNWNAQDVNFGLTETCARERPGGRQRPGRRCPQAQGARTTRTCSRCPRASSGHQHVHVAAARRAFYAPCVDGDFDMGVIGHEYGHMIENRMIGKGALPRRPPRRRHGREPRRPDFGMEYLQRERLRPDRRREPVRRGDVRDRQQGRGRSATTG